LNASGAASHRRRAG